jgi:membrane protease YdiL (CAAX protease family)
VQFVVSAVAGPETATEVEAMLRRWHHDQLSSRIWWACIAVVTYTVLPVLVLKFVFRAKLTDYGLKVRSILNAWPLYVLFVCVMVPLVWIFSATEHFQNMYPFLRVTSREQVHTELWKWELAYAAQFIALEFFFRGFLVHGTKLRFGVYAVFVSMVPYVQIHFQKPMPEATASIIAGIVLGYMSLVTRSVWLGAALHIGVAWGMDSACLYRKGLL